LRQQHATCIMHVSFGQPRVRVRLGRPFRTQYSASAHRASVLPTSDRPLLPCVCREPLAQCASIATVLRSCLVSFLHGVGADPKFPKRVPKFPKRVPKFPQRVPAALINTAEPRPSVLFRRRMTARSTRACATVASRRIRSGAHPFHVIGTGLTPATAALGLGPPRHICAGTVTVAAPALRPTRLHSASGIIGRALVSVNSMEGVRRLTGAIVRSDRALTGCLCLCLSLPLPSPMPRLHALSKCRPVLGRSYGGRPERA
jgi:hypothetical protein